MPRAKYGEGGETIRRRHSRRYPKGEGASDQVVILYVKEEKLDGYGGMEGQL